MRKVERLFEIIQLLRGQRLRTAETIASHLGISTRTVYRDIQSLMASGLPIEGERGIGYLIRLPITLPPLPLTVAEVQAVSVGLGLVASLTDNQLRQAAQEAQHKINAVLPDVTPHKLSSYGGIHVYAKSDLQQQNVFAALHTAIDSQKICHLDYETEAGTVTTRYIYPLALEYWGHVWTLAAWCCLRNDFRAFRLDRIKSFIVSDKTFTTERGKSYTDYKVSALKFAS